jgi:DNA-binding response OmpR family regulator
VRHAQQARSHAAQGNLHCILLDLTLPDGDGQLLLTEWRSARIQTPVLVMTARDALADRLKALRSGADDYVIKPFATEELIARVQALIRRSGGHTQQRWQVGDLCLDEVTAQVSIADQTIALTPREAAILRELALARGRAVSRETLMDRVWGLGRRPAMAPSSTRSTACAKNWAANASAPCAAWGMRW